MSRNRILLITCFVVIFAAGVAAGMFVAALGRGKQAGHGRSWLMDQLNLSDDQRTQVRDIWSKARESGGRGYLDRRRALGEARDKALGELVAPDQRPQFQALMKDHADKLKELSDQRKKAYDQALEQMRRVLTPEQSLKYDELMKEQPGHGYGGRRTTEPGPGTGATDSRTTVDETRDGRGGL